MPILARRLFIWSKSTNASATCLVMDMVGANAALPLTDVSIVVSGLEIKGHPSMVSVGIVNADYFRTLGIPLKKGRWSTDQDRAGKPLVALVNESFVQRYSPNEEPLGKRIGSGMLEMMIVASHQRRDKIKSISHRDGPQTTLAASDRITGTIGLNPTFQGQSATGCGWGIGVRPPGADSNNLLSWQMKG